jgi:hypothetical protein
MLGIWISGVITATNQTAAGPASAVRFTVKTDLPSGPVTMSDVRPCGPKPDDGWDVDTRPYTNENNNCIVGYMKPNNDVRWHVPMWPDAYDCEET